MDSKKDDITDNFNILEDITKIKTTKRTVFFIYVSIQVEVKHNFPFLKFLLKKETSGKENMDFLFYISKKRKYRKEIVDYLNKINNDYNTETLIVNGFIHHGVTVIFVEYTGDNDIELLKRKDKYWWSLSFEIISLKKVCNFPVSKTVSSFFIKNSELLYFNKK